MSENENNEQPVLNADGLPENPNECPLDVLRAMTTEKRKAYVATWRAKDGSTNWMRGRGKGR